MNPTDPRLVPVIIGVGQLSDRTETDPEALDTLQLMLAALGRADLDAGGGWLSRADSLDIVEQMTWPQASWPRGPKITPWVTAALGIHPRHAATSAEPTGDAPIRLLDDAANRIARGESDVALVVGAEALRTAARRGASNGDLIRETTFAAASALRRRYGLLTPTDVYPLYENACRAAWGQSLAEAQAESGAIWSGLSASAAQNEDAWLRKFLTAEEIVTPSPANRLIAFPYTKRMVANAAVNQGAALVLASLAVAREAGIAEERLVYVGAGAAAHEAPDFLMRERYDFSTGMTVTLEEALARNGLSAQDLDLVELYSCFPCIPKMARRILGWPLDRPHSVYGGLSFGGGPIGNCMTHAAVSMVRRLRAGARRGLIFANGGFADHNHAIVLTRDRPPDGLLPRDYDCQSLADRRRGTAPRLLEQYAGPGRIETYTVPCDRNGAPLFGTIIGRTPAGERFLARLPRDDAAGIELLVSGRREAVGTHGTAREGADGTTLWQPDFEDLA